MSICLLKNENILKILDYLQQKYNFNPKYISLDFDRGPYTAFRYKYPNSKIVPCFFHFIQRLIIHLPELKSKENPFYMEAKDLLANIKLLCFINTDQIEEFYTNIKKKYKKNFKNFLRYFDDTYMYRGLFSDKCWNYYNITSYSNNNELFFFTNNICESKNRALNNRVIGFCKSYFSFSHAILDLIHFFDNKNKYEERYVSITRSLDYYVKKSKNIKLITNEDLTTIKEEYDKFRSKNKLP